MNDIPPIAPLPLNQRAIDADHLNLLSIFHFIIAGVSLLGILGLILHFTIMHAVFTNPTIWQDQRQMPPPTLFFNAIMVLYVVLGLCFVGSAILNIVSGVFLQARKYRTFSFVVAGINCLQFPFGTILGIFTIIVLARESVRQLYEVRNGRGL